MIYSQIRKGIAFTGLAALFAMSAATAQVNARGDTGIDATGNTASERNACMTGRTQQDRATCLKEANNAAADKRRGVLTNSGDFTANALARCGVLNGTDRAACEARVLGYGSAAGSVAGGGVVKEVEVIMVPADPNQPVRIEPQTASPIILTVPMAPTPAQ